MDSVKEQVYARLPILAQHAAVSAFGLYWAWLRFGPGFRRELAEYRERERFDATQWRVWQRARVQATLTRAASEVAFYRDRWSESEKRAARAGRLEEVPLLEKDPVRADPRRFLRKDVSARRPLVFSTSGSTGTPISCYCTVAELRSSLALREARSANWAQTSFRYRRATFSGRMVVPDPCSPGPYHRFNVVEGQVYFSAFHLTPNTAKQYVDALWRHRVEWLTGYAVSYYLLARLMLEQDLRAPPLRALVTTSEKLTEEMRRVMEQAFGCRVFEEYSSVEDAVFASECEHGRLHVSPDASHVEILRPDGTPCEPGEVGEVVTTSLLRRYQPFIRYRLGDQAAWSGEPCTCGRALPVLEEVLGRVEDVVVGPDGRQMVRFHGVFLDLPQIREAQVVQESLTALRLRVVPAGLPAADRVFVEAELVRRVTERLGPSVTCQIEWTPEIPRTRAGKFKAVVSYVSSPRSVDSERARHAE